MNDFVAKRRGVLPAARMAAALAAGLCAGAASAQTNITVYGIVDTAFTHTTNVDEAGHAMTKMPTLTGSVPSRLGFRGSEDLGNGLQPVFTLESGINVDVGTPSQGGRLFGRQASVGLKGGWGTLQVGRVPNMTFYAMIKSDVLGPNLFSVSSIDLYIPNARSDNAVSYMGVSMASRWARPTASDAMPRRRAGRRPPTARGKWRGIRKHAGNTRPCWATTRILTA